MIRHRIRKSAALSLPRRLFRSPRVRTLRSEPTKSQIRGFIFSRNLSNLTSGVLFFPEISAIFLFFSENLINFVALFGPPFGPLFERFPPVKRLKHPKNFSRALRAEFIFFSNLESGFYFFQKSQQSQIRGFIFSRNLTNVSNPGFA